MTIKAKYILIVEDERPLARALELKLTKEGYKTSTAANGSDAVSLLEKGDYDVMVLDLVMPQYDGFHVLEYVHEKKIAIKTIVLSNLSQNEDIKKAKDFGAIEYFVKSNTPIVDLVEKVKQALQ